jgi:predicted ribosome quality control (RQC) complex YloA/Tae2 family protein
VVVDDVEVLVGRGDAENDYLTFEVAEPHDFWLHVAGGIPGRRRLRVHPRASAPAEN